ncbi:hypothetical protein AHiyo8_57890 [Arthrobacter sp. Hiyo8]|nr:hypothetical protein AHiyo8_57890 [Arthrobacter sp. Hiyo8]
MACEDQDVVLVDEGDVLSGTLAGAAEGVTDNALDAVGRVERYLGGNLVGGAPRSVPPLPTYGPSVPSRTTMKSMSPGLASGLPTVP